MKDSYSQIQFIAANYSKLQGLREVPVGLLVVAVAVWGMYNHGAEADLTIPVLAIAAAALLYWLIDRFYVRTFGRIHQTAKMRSWEIAASVLFGTLAFVAFWLDTAQALPVSALGLVFSAELFEDFWRATYLVRGRSFQLYPENLLAACLILVLSLLPLAGLTWWEILGIQSQLLGVLTAIGILLIIAGVWGHLRILRILPAREVHPDANSI